MPGKIGILLSGLGYDRGTQILELPFIYREIERSGGSPICLAPRETVPVAGRGKILKPRDLLEECLPIARGDMTAVEDVDNKYLDALIIPGGKGPITVLSDTVDSGPDAHAVRSVREMIVGLHVRKKPIGTLGYGGALLMVALKHSIEQPIITMGEDTALISSLSPLGIAPVNVGPQEVIHDSDNCIFSAAGISPGSSIAKGADAVECMTISIMEHRGR